MLLVRRPRGVVGVITPWNWPYTMPAELIAPALACGNTVVWTPAPTTSVAGVALAECVAEADLPAGVFNLVTGPGPVVGDEIARNPGTHGVGFIGSTATGRKVAEAAAGKACRARARRQRAGRRARRRRPRGWPPRRRSTACFLCAGQSCTAGERLLVHRDVREEFVARLAALVAERVVLGDPFADGDDARPAEQRAGRGEDGRARRRRGRARRPVVAGGARAAGFPTDLYWQATILDGVPADSLVAREETFGPVAPIVEIDSLEQAIELDERLAVRAARGDLHARPRAGACASPTRCAPAG